MINLLPPTEKDFVQKEYHFRLGSVYLALFSVVIIIGIVLLLPSYFLADIRVDEVREEIEILKASEESSEREQVNKELRATNARLLALTKEEATIELFKIIDDITFDAGGSISLSQFAYSRGNEETFSTLNLRGFAKTRNDLLLFTRALEENELFDEVDLPVSSLAQDEDIDFSIITNGTF